MSRPFVPSEGIRFLDDQPKAPAPPETPAKPVKEKKKRRFPIGTLAFLTVIGLGIAKHHKHPHPHDARLHDEIERSFDVQPGTTVEVETTNGSIRVEAGPSGKVDCKAERHASAPDPEMAKAALTGLVPEMVQEGNVIRLKIKKADWFRPGWEGGANLVVMVPSDTVVKASSENGPIEARGLDAGFSGRSKNGPIFVRDGRGAISAETTNGPIECEATEARVLLQTSNGPIEFRGDLADGESKIESSNAGVKVKLPDDQKFRIDAKTSNGKIQTDFEIEGESKKNKLVGSRGDSPSTQLVIHTSNGEVEIERLDD